MDCGLSLLSPRESQCQPIGRPVRSGLRDPVEVGQLPSSHFDHLLLLANLKSICLQCSSLRRNCATEIARAQINAFSSEINRSPRPRPITWSERKNIFHLNSRCTLSFNSWVYLASPATDAVPLTFFFFFFFIVYVCFVFEPGGLISSAFKERFSRAFELPLGINIRNPTPQTNKKKTH